MDIRPSFPQEILLTLGSANVVTTVTLPFGTNGFRLYCSADVRYSLDAAPVSPVNASSSATVAPAAFGAGATAKASTLDERQIPEADGITTTLQLASSTGAATVMLEVF